MAKQYIAVETCLNVPYETDMLGDGMHVTPGPLHGVCVCQPTTAGQRQ